MTAARFRPPLGTLKRRLTLEASVRTDDGAGGETVAWSPVASLWGRLEWLSGEERERADRPEQVARYRVLSRWRAGVDAGQRFVLGGRVFDIRSAVDPDGDRRRLVCLVEEITP